jgi:hypothetical protein
MVRKFRKMTETVRQRYINNHRDELEAYAEYTNQELRAMVFNLIGHECVSCGEDDMRCLSIDHVEGGGSRERAQMGARFVYIKIIGKRGHGYQTLCLNCQAIKRIEENEQ